MFELSYLNVYTYPLVVFFLRSAYCFMELGMKILITVIRVKLQTSAVFFFMLQACEAALYCLSLPAGLSTAAILIVGAIMCDFNCNSVL